MSRGWLGEEQRAETLWAENAARANGLRQERPWQVGGAERRVVRLELWLWRANGLEMQLNARGATEELSAWV